MLEARIERADVFKKLIEAMKDLVTEAMFEFSDTGVQLQSMDSSHVSLCFVELEKKTFEHYRCDQNYALGLSLPNLAKVLKCAGADDVLTLKYKDESDVLSLMFENEEQDRIMDFDLTLMDLDQDQLQIPETDYQCIVKLETDQFKKIISDMLQLGDTTVITCKKDSIKFSIEGDVGKANITLKKSAAADDKEKTQISVLDPVELRFALRYLNYFTKASPLSKMVTLSLRKDVPLLVEYDIEQNGTVQYFLAPKIDDE